MSPQVVSVSCSHTHTFSKPTQKSILVLKGLGVKGDAHCGKTIKHRSRVAADPSQPNLRQLHLLHSELFQELQENGFELKPGDLGENILTQGIDLLALPRNSLIKIGADVVVQVTGLRNPCHHIEEFQSGLLKAVIETPTGGVQIKKAGIMSIVLEEGTIKVGDPIHLELPPEPHEKLERV
jgi:MOSC domain-containing protein YiiM